MEQTQEAIYTETDPSYNIDVTEDILAVQGVTSRVRVRGEQVIELDDKQLAIEVARIGERINELRLNSRRSGASEDIAHLYMDDLGRKALLTKDDERVLGQAVERGLGAKEQLLEIKQKKSDVPISRRRELGQQLTTGNEATKIFIETNLRLVVSIAKRYQASGMPFLDLVQEGNIGLMHAVEKFDWRRGFKFSTYSTWWIKQSITRGIAYQSRTIRLPVHRAEAVNQLQQVQLRLHSELQHEPTITELAKEMEREEDDIITLIRDNYGPASLQAPVGDNDTELGDILEDKNHLGDPEEAVQRLAEIEAITDIVDTLPDTPKQVIALYHGLDGGGGRNFAEIAGHLGFTENRTRSIYGRAMEQLRISAGFLRE